MYAHVVMGAVKIESEHRLDGQLVLETTCRDYDHYRTLPDVVTYKGVECTKTGWSSDRNYACYKEGGLVAYTVNKRR